MIIYPYFINPIDGPQPEEPLPASLRCAPRCSAIPKCTTIFQLLRDLLIREFGEGIRLPARKNKREQVSYWRQDGISPPPISLFAIGGGRVGACLPALALAFGTLPGRFAGVLREGRSGGGKIRQARALTKSHPDRLKEDDPLGIQ